MEKYEVNKYLSDFKARVKSVTRALNLDELNKRNESLLLAMQKDDFWSNPKTASSVSRESNLIQKKIRTIENISKKLEDILEWYELVSENTEEWEILVTDIKEFQEELSNFELETLLSGPHDDANAIVSIHAGSGGTEAQDWADMLFRMYQRYANKANYKFELLDYLSGDEAGIKSVTFSIKGDYAFGYLKAEKGVHRLVRISPFDANAKRHTSFAAVDVMPEISDDIELKINDEDIKVDVYRSSGAGGQSVNTTDSAVRITHLPTNTVVTCQNERSQIKNREVAMKLLRSKLLQLEMEKQEEELRKIKGEQKDIAWGSQIRSYVFHPYQMVKDHRTNFEVGNVDQVMDGDIESFIDAYLRR